MKFITSCAPPRRRKAGFSLVEIMIAVVIIGLLVMLAYPAFNKLLRSSANARFISDIRVFSQSFENYSMETGLWPPNAGSGVVPLNMASSVRRNNWVAPTSVGELGRRIRRIQLRLLCRRFGSERHRLRPANDPDRQAD
jgi:prepilin-type N-terminal cleavage/methylation domain-containing protein